MKQASKSSNDRDLTETDNTAYKPAYKKDSENPHQGNSSSPELQAIINQWDDLPEHVKDTIKMLVDTAGKKSKNT